MILPDDEIDKEFQIERDGVKALFDIEDELNFEENFEIFKSFVIQTKEKYPIPSFYQQIIEEFIGARPKQSQWMIPKIIEFYKELFPNNELILKQIELKANQMDFIYNDYIITIMNDDYDGLLNLINNGFYDIDYCPPIPSDFFYTITDPRNRTGIILMRTQNRNVNLHGIDIAAFFGSQKCFKYFCMNNSAIYYSTFICAFIGGSFEIIRILEQKGYKFNNEFFYTQRSNSIDMH